MNGTPHARLSARELLTNDDDSDLGRDAPDPLIEDLVDEFLAARRVDAARLDELLAAEDYEAIRRIGHNLRGCGAPYGFPRLTTVGAVLEAAAAEHDIPMVQEATTRLRRYLAAI